MRRAGVPPKITWYGNPAHGKDLDRFTQPAFYDSGVIAIVKGLRVATIEKRGRSHMKRRGGDLARADDFRAAFPKGLIPPAPREGRSRAGRLLGSGDRGWKSFEEGWFEVVAEGDADLPVDGRETYRNIEVAIAAAWERAGQSDPLPPRPIACQTRSVREAMNRR